MSSLVAQNVLAVYDFSSFLPQSSRRCAEEQFDNLTSTIPLRSSATFAIAIVAPLGDDYYGIAGYRASGADLQDVVQLELRGVSAAGDYPMSGAVVIAQDYETALPEQVFSLRTGTVRVTALSATRIAGEFSGMAVGGAFPPPPLELPSDTVYPSAGRFDVPIIRR